MTDVFSSDGSLSPLRFPDAREPLQPPEPIYDVIELLFFGYRDFVRGADAVLARYGFGRAHHRVLHFVSRHPGLRVTELLDILKITKQSLGRVLRELVDTGFVTQTEGPVDRRQRLLFATDAGARLARELADLQSARIEAALRMCGPNSHEAARSFLFAMVDAEEREAVASLISRNDAAESTPRARS